MPKTDHLLINRAIQGDESAWGQLVSWYLPLVYHWCRQRNFRSDVSADIAQTVFLKVSQGLPKFENAEAFASFRSWLRTLSRNVMVDWLRKNGDEIAAKGGTTAQELINSIEDEHLPKSTANDDRLLAKVDEVRNEFSEATWNAFWLTGVEGLSGSEVSQELGITRAAVYQAKYRVAQRLRAAIHNKT